MAKVFDLPEMGPTKRLIMLALADHADDAGRCYPSIDRLANRTGLSERAVRNNIRTLESQGFLRTEKGAGPHGCNLFFVNPSPAPDAGGQEVPPAGGSPQGGQQVPQRGAGGAPEPSGTVNKPSTPLSPRKRGAGSSRQYGVSEAVKQKVRNM